MQDTRNVSPDLYLEQRYREGKFYCDICGDPWPMSHQRRMRSGVRVGVKCCYEPNGDDVARDQRRAAAAKFAAQQSAVEQEPPRAPDGSVYAGNKNIAADSYITSITPNPIVLNRGGAAVAVVLAGQGFVSTDTIVYGNAGITDNSAPVNVSATEWDLSVKASGGMAAGKYTLSFNGTVWQAVFDVR